MILNSKNYYDKATDIAYQSPTFFKKFLTCEAETMAELNGEYKPSIDNKALLAGNYLHSYFESPEAHQQFIDEHKDDLLSKRKPYGLLKEYKSADKMIDTLKNDEGFQQLYQGDKEVIVAGQIDGINWKGKIDCLNLENGYFVDLKTTQDIHKKYWSVKEHEWQPFIYKWNYQLQMYVYQELIHQKFDVWCEPYIVAVSKQDVPDKETISIPNEKIAEAQLLIEEKQPHIEDVKSKNIQPMRCEKCDYCRLTKKLGNIVSADSLID